MDDMSMMISDQGHIAYKAEAPRGSLGWLWRSQRQDQAKSNVHPCTRQPHAGRAQRCARRYVGGGGGGGGAGGGGGGEGGDEDWFKLLSNCPVTPAMSYMLLYQQCECTKLLI